MVKLMAVIVGLGVGLQEGVGDHEEVVSLSYPGRGIKVIPAAAAVDQAPVCLLYTSSARKRLPCSNMSFPRESGSGHVKSTFAKAAT